MNEIKEKEKLNIDEKLKKIILKMKSIKIETDDLQKMKETFRDIQALRTYISYQYAITNDREFRNKLNILLKNMSYMFDTQSRILTIIEIENNRRR